MKAVMEMGPVVPLKVLSSKRTICNSAHYSDPIELSVFAEPVALYFLHWIGPTGQLLL